MQTDFETLCTEFLRAKEATGRSPMTLRSYRYALECYQKFCSEMGYSESDLYDAGAIEEFFGVRSAEVAEYTIFDYFRTLRALFRWGVKRRLIAENPIDMIDTPSVTTKLPRRITHTEMLQIVVQARGDHWLDVRDRLIVQTLFYCGLRASELCRMRVADVNVDERIILARRTKTKGQDLIPFPKSLQTLMRTYLAVRPADHDYLWVSQHQNYYGDLKPTGLRQMLRRRCQAAGLPEYGAHAFRHGCAVAIIQNSGDVSLVQRVLGHADVSTSGLYLRFDTASVQNLYDRVFA